MKYGLLTYMENRRFFNIGDYIQSLAARQYLPRIDSLINRDSLADYDGGPTKLIMNGWFTHNAANWIPSCDIDAFFTSFHVNNTAAPLMLSPEGIGYLKRNEPIGCRDQFTVDILSNAGIEAFFSGCLTLTLDNYKVDDSERTDDVYVVDPLYGYTTLEKVTYSARHLLRSVSNGKIMTIGRRRRHLRNLLDDELMRKARWVRQEPPANTFSDSQKFAMAEDLLRRYARAKLVITSRIHCALPCLALGTPVIFINGFESEVDSCRFGGINELFNRVDVNATTGEYTYNCGLEGKLTRESILPNPTAYKALAEPLKLACRAFVTARP